MSIMPWSVLIQYNQGDVLTGFHTQTMLSVSARNLTVPLLHLKHLLLLTILSQLNTTIDSTNFGRFHEFKNKSVRNPT